eukprot:UN0275
MKEFAKLAGREYVPNFEEALTDGSTKMAKRVLADLSAHFDQVVQSFGDVVTKFESAARCINVAAPQRARNFTITGTAVAMIAAAFVTLITAYYLEASAFTLCALAAVFAILTMGCRAMANTDANRSARQQGMCDHFASSMWQVKAIVAKHTEELRTSQSSLKALVTDDLGALARLVDDWQRDDDGKKQLKKDMERVRYKFSALEDNCFGWTQALSGL